MRLVSSPNAMHICACLTLSYFLNRTTLNSHWPGQPISPNEMVGREEEIVLLHSNTHQDVPEPEAPPPIVHAV